MSRLVMPAIEMPRIPFGCGIPAGVRAGLIVRIQGTVPFNAHRFHVNFASGTEISGPYRSNIPFHFNPRFDENYVARNTLVGNEWGTEEMTNPSELPFARDRPFEIMVLVEPTQYKVAVDGRHFLEYKHRIPLEEATSLQIGGDVTVYKIEFMEPQVLGFSTAVTPNIKESLNPVLPYEQGIPGGLAPGRTILMTARPKPYADRFSINLICGGADDVAFHFNPRFALMSEERACVIVRNTRNRGVWGAEERETPYFPFQPGFNFDLLLRCEELDFLVAVNGQHLISYRHRLPFRKVDLLKIEGDLDVMLIRA